MLALRTDMTIPIARLVATRYPAAELPLRFCYFAHAYRGVRPHRGQMREFLQAGIELVGAPAPTGTAEALSVMCHALAATGLRGYKIGLGDASLYRTLLRSFGLDDSVCDRLVGTLVRRDFVELEAELGQLDLSTDDAALLLHVPQMRGGPDVLSEAEGPVSDAVAGLRSVYELLAPEVAERVIFDLGLAHDLGYYTGAVFEVYDPALGAPLGRGGRYDDLLGRFGRPLPAVGFALGIDRLHIALTGEEAQRMSLGLTIAVPRGALMNETLDRLDAIGLDTSEVRTNDRKLLFGDIGVVTMRPSDVPTYVEAGAADVGITGKDVLTEQSERDVYELMDLGFGRCVMVLATVDGPDPSVEALRRLGVMRVATKYYKTAIAYFEQTGRQAEIVEVKGSVELAPLTGLVEAIVDLTATGTTLRENNLVIREELFVSTARLIANPVSHKLKAAAIDSMLEKLRAP